MNVNLITDKSRKLNNPWSYCFVIAIIWQLITDLPHITTILVFIEYSWPDEPTLSLSDILELKTYISNDLT